ncbi:hypothetical protein R1flu_006395 [Riccia fluitans]|uniref:Uncharacterized protein n=1 Tax=Riccia fluitans TaxID=41844 RepID=A0ABD1YVW8_9MARC
MPDFGSSFAEASVKGGKWKHANHQPRAAAFLSFFYLIDARLRQLLLFPVGRGGLKRKVCNLPWWLCCGTALRVAGFCWMLCPEPEGRRLRGVDSLKQVDLVHRPTFCSPCE